MKTIAAIVLLWGGIWMAAAAPAAADIYVYIDSAGTMHFTNTPTHDGYRFYIREKSPRPELTDMASDYDGIIKEAAQTHGVDMWLLKAIIKTESNFDPKAVSHKGAKGLMQIMPATQAALNIADVFNPRQNIMGGCRYVRSLLDRFGGRLPLTLAAYNAGPSVVAQYNGIPPYPETREYVEKVMRFYNALKRSK